MSKIDGLSQLFKGFSSLSNNENKVDENNPDLEVGVISDKIPELKLNMSDEELISLSDSWLKKYKQVAESSESNGTKSLKEKRKDNEKYWLGKQYSDVEQATEDRPLVDNLIFEALETFLPIATKQNPEPMVSADDSEEGQLLAKNVQKILNYLFDVLKIRLKMKQVVRDWSLKYVGVIKVGWSILNNEIDCKVIRPENIILDPNATVEGGYYDGKFLGEWKKDTAGDLKRRFPSKKSFIDSLANGKDGTEIAYIEWWTPDALFWTLKNEVLDKVKNPHYVYEKEEKRLKAAAIDLDIEGLDEDDDTLFETVKIEGNNHFPSPRIPYVILNVFSLGKHPWDETGLIEQNLSLQDLINKRQRQIDKNVDGMNGGWAISLERAGLTKEQASQAVKAFRTGGAVAIPKGIPRDAVERMVGQGLPNDVFNNLIDARNELRGIFGVTGISPQGLQQENTVRGKILNRGSDIDRIGGGITDYIEQFMDYLYNWFVQMMYVYYDEKHSASVLGDQGASEFIELSNEDLNKKLVVSVKEGSLIPKDPLTKRNVAIDLWGAGAIDPLTLYQRLDEPNPRQSVERLIKWQSNPAGLLDEGDGEQPQEQMMGQPMEQPMGQVPIQPMGQMPQPSPETNLINQVPIQ